jgi:RNA polymerase sigma-70 factor (ECF subfamily)
LRRRLETEDLAQSAYHDALRALDRWEGRGKGSFRKWLLGILRNKFRRKLAGALAERRDARREVALGDVDRSASSGGDPCLQVLRAEDREHLLRAVEALPDKWRRVVHLRYFEGLAWREVGERLDLSEEAAQMLCHRALKSLHAEFATGSGSAGA